MYLGEKNSSKLKHGGQVRFLPPKLIIVHARLFGTLEYTANIYSGNLDTRKKCKSYKYLP